MGDLSQATTTTEPPRPGTDLVLRPRVHPPMGTARTTPLHRTLAARIALGVGVTAVMCAPVVAISIAVGSNYRPLLDWDERVLQRATTLVRRRPLLWKSMVAWEKAAQPLHTYLAAVPAVAWVWLGAKAPKDAIWGAATLGASWHLGLDVKAALHRNRPSVDEPLTATQGYSFPSGHVFHNTLVTATTVLTLWPCLPRRWRGPVAAGAATVCATTAFNRLSLGAHYASDVIAGGVLAAAVVAGSWVGASPRRSWAKRPR